AAALFALLGWLVLEASDMSDAANAGRPRRGNPGSARHELRPRSHRPGAFGARGARASDRAAVAALCGRGARGLALTLHARHSHAFAMERGPSLLLYGEGLHLLAGGAWLGGLPPLLILVRHARPEPSAETLRRFPKLATLCVIAIAGTACF